MGAETTQSLGTWECNYCGDTEGVVNGVCPNCGPSQTKPVDDVAKKEAGVYEEPVKEETHDEVKDTPEE